MANKMINDTIFETLNVIAINTLKGSKILLALLKYFFYAISIYAVYIKRDSSHQKFNAIPFHT